MKFRVYRNYKHLFFLFSLIILGGCQQDRSDAGQPAAKGGERIAQAQAKIVFDGEELPISRVSCAISEARQSLRVIFDMEPEHFLDLRVLGNPAHLRERPQVTLKLPTELDAPQGFDLWRSSDEENLPILDTGVNGSFMIEGENIGSRGSGVRDAGLLEVNITCPT